MNGPVERMRLDVTLLWDRTTGCGAIFLCLLLSGCSLHKQQAPPLAPQAKTPNVYVPPPTTDRSLPPMPANDTPPNLTDAKPAVAAEAKPKRHVKRQPASSSPSVPAPVPNTPPAAAPEPPPAALGGLSPGGGPANAQQLQEVTQKIAAVEKRIATLPGSLADNEQKPLAQVRLFLKEASDALKGGDLEGAEILATKADLLLDDLKK